MFFEQFCELFLRVTSGFVNTSRIGIQTKGENLRNTPNLIFGPQDNSFICTKFQGFVKYFTKSN